MDVYSTELVIRLNFVKTSEFRGAPLAETRVKSQDSLCKIFCGQNGAGIGVSLVILFMFQPFSIITRMLGTHH
jgi:hypothetical protein